MSVVNKWRLLVAGLYCVVLFGCSDSPPDPWSEEDLAKFTEQMINAGRAFAVADTCMPLIEEDDDVRTRVTLEISAKRYAQLLSINSDERVEEMLAFYENAGGREEEIDALETAYRISYDATLDDLTSVEVCAQTIIDFHNTILNAKVRQR